MNTIERKGPPQAIQKLRDSLYLIQVTLSEPPSADWKRLFYDAQPEAPPDFHPRAADLSGTQIRFRADAESVAAKVGWIDRWIARANQKQASARPPSEEERRRREQLAVEQRELEELNARWEKL